MLEVYNPKTQIVKQIKLDSTYISDLIPLATNALLIASGNELSMIHNKFHNLVIHRTEEPQIFSGAMAEFILFNLVGFEEHFDMPGIDILALDNDFSLTVSFNIGERLSSTNLTKISATNYVLARPKGVAWIANNFPNIPLFTGQNDSSSGVWWSGDFARFIVGQLPALDGQQ